MKAFNEIDKQLWQTLSQSSSPFVQYEFFKALHSSASIGPQSGWQPLFFVDPDGHGLLFSFIKSHSYGEYIFDWEWARAYQTHGLAYYPKLTSMIPFTPVTHSSFIMPQWNETVAQSLLLSLEKVYDSHPFSSIHFLFIQKEMISFFERHHYLVRESVQYHFFNEGHKDFDSFLQTLKSKRAKNIRKERIFPHLKIERFTGAELQTSHAKRMYQFYLSTIDDKGAIDYLKEDFFVQVFQTMPQNVLYVEAAQDGKPIAGSLFFYDEEKLYGRYWGSHESIDNLHFELCYYQGMDFCFERGLKVFEAGAQGEHKVLRGFKPSKTYSAHRLKDPRFEKAIAEYIQQEKLYLKEAIQRLSGELPFKHLSSSQERTSS